MASQTDKNSERLFTWTQLYELTRLPQAPKRSVGRPQETAFPRKLMGFYLNAEEKELLLNVQSTLEQVLDKKPSYGEVLGIMSRIYSTIIAEEHSKVSMLTRGFVRPKGGRKMVSFQLSDGERREFSDISKKLQGEPDLENVNLSYGDIFVILATAFQETLSNEDALLESESLIVFAQDFVSTVLGGA